MRKISIIFVALIVGAILCVMSALKCRNVRAEIERTQANVAVLENGAEMARVSNRDAEQRVLQIEKEARAAGEKLAADPNWNESAVNDIWSSPPKEWPEWNPKSPFIWVDKEVLPKLPLQTIAKGGEITKEIAEILGVSGAQLDRLNQKLIEIVAENRTLAQSSAEIINDENVLSTGQDDGTKITVKIEVPKDMIAGMKDRYESAIRDEIGEARKDLLCRSIGAQSWLDTEFRTKPEVISVIRHPNGTYNIGFKERGSSFGGMTRLEGYLPDFVLPFFDSIRNKTE